MLTADHGVRNLEVGIRTWSGTLDCSGAASTRVATFLATKTRRHEDTKKTITNVFFVSFVASWQKVLRVGNTAGESMGAMTSNCKVLIANCVLLFSLAASTAEARVVRLRI